MRHIALIFTCAAMVPGCGDDKPQRGEVQVDPVLTRSTVFGVDPLISAKVDRCGTNPAARIYVDGEKVLEVPAVVIFVIEYDDAQIPAKQVFQLDLDASSLAGRGMPARASIEVEAKCPSGWERSEPFELTHIPTNTITMPAFNPVRFWPADEPGDVLACEGLTLRRYLGAQVADVEVALPHTCNIGELRGSDPAARRYLVAPDLGITAIDPEPSVPWSRSMVVSGATRDAVWDPAVTYVVPGDDRPGFLALLDAATGEDLVEPVPLAHATLGDPKRDPGGDILVLERERQVASIVYYVQRFDAGGVELSLSEVARYPVDAPSYIAEFDEFGDHIYVVADPNGDGDRWVEKIDLTDCAATCSVVWQTSPDDGWVYPLGEAYGRLLVASTDDFTWLDPDTNAALSVPFAPKSGIQFHRAAVEPDGSVVMIGDPGGNIGQGLYVFAPDGEVLIDVSGSDLLFRWMTTAWGDGVLVSYFDELHLLETGARYAAMKAAP